MFGPTGTARKIDDFESRFPIVNGAHFMIAANGKEAWPVSAAEAADFRALYRRRMKRARWIRRGALLAIVPLLVLMAQLVDEPPGRMGPGWQIAYALVLLALPLFALLQHPLTSDLTKAGVERRLRHRITTRHPPALVPALTPLARFARALLAGVVVAEIGLMLLQALLGRDALAAHMRVLTGMVAGNEDWLAQATGTIGRLLPLALLLGLLLLRVDRKRREAEAREAAEAAEARMSAFSAARG
ncbi:MAG TPA: hypothetical protein VEX35_05455 [Allosphingosinicella sp.]|nr:hypothetical protein [Allosphingosinicella sp.]